MDVDSRKPTIEPPTWPTLPAPFTVGSSQPRGPYDHHYGEDDAKAKRYWFNRQDNGIYNYCGYRYPYDWLEMEHMIQKEMGRPDDRRNMQLAGKRCN